MPKNEVEALLFSAGKNMNVDNIAAIIGIDRNMVISDLQELKKEYSERDCALIVLEEGEQWKIHVREEYLPLVRKIVADTELPKAVLETLAIVAYRSPVLQADIINARSDAAYEHISILQDMGFLTKEKKGRSFELKVTEKFFEYFDVEGDKSMKELLKKVKSVDAPKKDKDEKLDPELYDLKHHKPHGGIVEITSAPTADPDRQKPEPEKIMTVIKPVIVNQEADVSQDVSQVLDSVELKIQEIMKHRKKFAESVQDDSKMP